MNYLRELLYYMSAIPLGRRLVLSALFMAVMALDSSPAIAGQSKVTYLPPDLSGMSATQLKKYYKWRNKMDWLLAPIHSRAELQKYIRATATSGSPLDALPPEARNRFLSSMEFGQYGAGGFNFSDLQYLSTPQVYRILALFGEQSMAVEITGGRIRTGEIKSGTASAKPSFIGRQFDKYWKAVQASFGEAWEKRSQIAGDMYDRLFSANQNPGFLRKVGDNDLRLMFRAAGLAAFYTLEARYAKDAYMDFEAMERRHFATWPDYKQMYQTLIGTRQFDAAQKFYKAHPVADLTPLPAYHDAAKNAETDTPTILVVSTTKRELTRRSVDLDAPAQVVILTDPNCHFARDFDQVLQTHSKLRKVLEQHAMWLAPPGTELEFDSLQQWDKAHPRQHVNIMYSIRGWPMTDVMGTPKFFFLQHGEVKMKHSGWPSGGDFPAVEAGLKAIGLWQ